MKGSWRNTLETYKDLRMLSILALGFSSGLPAPLVFSNLSIWLRDVGVSRTEIGLFALVATPYAINFLWAPLLDRMRLPWLSQRMGRRRSWALFTQVGLVAAILFLSITNPSENLALVALGCVFVTFLSATQDVVIDAYRIDVLEPRRHGAGSAATIWGWHLGGTLVGGAGGLYLAASVGWNASYAILAAAMSVGILAVLLSPEPKARPPAETLEAEARTTAWLRSRPGLARRPILSEAAIWVYGALIAPFADFTRRRGWLLILFFVFVFKLGDALLGRMSGVFYREMGFALTEIAHVSKVYGLAANFAGVALGGLLVARVGQLRALFLSGLLTAGTNLTYAWLAVAGKSMGVFIFAVMSDNFTTGLVTVAFVAYLSGLCNVAYTATHYALLASLANLARIWFSASAGAMVDALGGDWATFFVITAFVALLGLPLLVVIMKRFPEAHQQGRAENSHVS